MNLWFIEFHSVLREFVKLIKNLSVVCISLNIRLFVATFISVDSFWFIWCINFQYYEFISVHAKYSVRNQRIGTDISLHMTVWVSLHKLRRKKVCHCKNGRVLGSKINFSMKIHQLYCMANFLYVTCILPYIAQCPDNVMQICFHHNYRRCFIIN